MSEPRKDHEDAERWRAWCRFGVHQSAYVMGVVAGATPNDAADALRRSTTLRGAIRVLKKEAFGAE